jgi:hypothetical protein
MYTYRRMTTRAHVIRRQEGATAVTHCGAVLPAHRDRILAETLPAGISVCPRCAESAQEARRQEGAAEIDAWLGEQAHQGDDSDDPTSVEYTPDAETLALARATGAVVPAYMKGPGYGKSFPLDKV